MSIKPLAFAGFRRRTRFSSPARLVASPACLGAALFLLAALPAGAGDAAETLDGVARAASLMREIAKTCPPFGADAGEAEKFYRTFADAGTEAYGARFKAALARATARQKRETRARGPALWCEEQRERQRDIGNGRLFAPAR